MTAKRELILSGLGYIEAARWHDGELWFSDIQQRTINRVTAGGEKVVVATLQPRPSGLGWGPDGSTIAISMEDSRLVRLIPDGTEVLHDFGEQKLFINDMAVDLEGRAYISQFGYDLFGGEEPRPSGLLVRHPDGRLEEFGSGLTFANGIAISPDGRTLVTAESFAEPHRRLTAFDIAADGSLTNQRVFAELDAPNVDVLDGLCMDSEGAIWVAVCSGEFQRVVEGGTVTDVISIPPDGGNYCVDCVLGGEDLQTLYMLIADTTVERMGNNWDSSARIEAVRVDVPGFILGE